MTQQRPQRPLCEASGAWALWSSGGNHRPGFRVKTAWWAQRASAAAARNPLLQGKPTVVSEGDRALGQVPSEHLELTSRGGDASVWELHRTLLLLQSWRSLSPTHSQSEKQDLLMQQKKPVNQLKYLEQFYEEKGNKASYMLRLAWKSRPTSRKL